tara:strand:- start:17851 stop:18051 length:201 start_codon:yes stop_codon:yes gene_type:complete
MEEINETRQQGIRGGQPGANTIYGDAPGFLECEISLAKLRAEIARANAEIRHIGRNQEPYNGGNIR